MTETRAAPVMEAVRVRVSRKSLEGRMTETRAAPVMEAVRVRVSRKSLEKKA